MDQATHEKEILDLIFTNNADLVSSVTVEAWPVFTDHSLVTAASSFLVEKKEELEEVHLLESGKRLKKINFEKASMPEIQAELRKIDWSPMVVLADQNPTAAQTWLIDQLLPIMGKSQKRRSDLV